MTTVTFSLFGPPLAHRDGRPVDLGGPRSQRLMIALLLAKAQPIVRTSLLEWVWDDPEKRSNSTLNELMVKLRRLLTELELRDALDSRNGMCRLDIPPESVDVHRFDELVRSAWQAPDAARAVALFRKAFVLVTAEPFGNLNGLRIESNRQTLADRYLRARISCVELELRLGNHDRIIPELRELGSDQPRNEQIAVLRMLAHYRAGDQDAALGTYHDIRKQLEEIGVEVGTQLASLQQRVLNRDPTLEAPDPPSPVDTAGPGVLLRLTAPDGTTFAYPLSGKVVLGRKVPNAPPPDIVLDSGPDSWISRTHCTIEFDEGQWWVMAHGKNVPSIRHRGASESERLEHKRRIRLREGDEIRFPVGPDSAWRVEFSDPLATRTANGRGPQIEGEDQ